MVKHLNGGVKFLMYPRFVQVLLDNQVKGMKRHNAIFVIFSHTKKVLDLEEAKTAQAKKITSLKNIVKQLEQKRKSRTLGLKRLRKVGTTSRIESSTEASLGHQEDASKQGRMINSIDQDVEITLVDETRERMNEEDMFRLNDLDGDEAIVDTLIGIKAAKPKAITTAAGIRPKANGIVMQELSSDKAKEDSDKGEEGSSKRARRNLEQKDAKRQSYTPTIVDYKIYKEGKKSYFKIIRADDTIWKYQQGSIKVLNWKLFDSCGVYCITTKNMVDYEVEMAYDLLRLIRKQINKGYVLE
nr:hypothetical protein [Tanacetum cinerariifolium]